MKAVERHTTYPHCIFHNFLLAYFWHISGACLQLEKWNCVSSGHCWTSLLAHFYNKLPLCVYLKSLCSIFSTLASVPSPPSPMHHSVTWLCLLPEMRTGTISTCFSSALYLHTHLLPSPDRKLQIIQLSPSPGLSQNCWFLSHLFHREPVVSLCLLPSLAHPLQRSLHSHLSH